MMKGNLKTVSACEPNTDFNDWSDPKCKPLPESERVFCHESSKEQEPKSALSGFSLKAVASETTVEINEMRDKIRQGYPLISKKEIRTFRLPFYESLLQNLKEDGFLLTYAFIKDLIAIDDAYHRDQETNVVLKYRPVLKTTKSVLIPLSEGLTNAETSRVNEEKNQEASAFLDMAVLFSKAGDPSWNWIALEMFEQCMDVLKSTEKPVRNDLQATAKYLYGLFLFNELQDLNDAKTQTEQAMMLSEGKSWTIGGTKEKKGRALYTECCILLHNIFLKMAEREMINENTEEAIHMCRNGLLWAKVMNNKPAEVVALAKLINIYLTVQQLCSVPELLEKYMSLCYELSDYEAVCEGYILSARYHDSVEEKGNVIEDKNNLLRVAKEHGITKMVAMAHHKLATYCLMRGTDMDLRDHAIEAYMSYLDMKKGGHPVKELEEARCVVGVAQGLEIMTEYCNLVLNAENLNYTEQLVLHRWKGLRIPFFDKNFQFIPEIEANAKIQDKMENKRLEEMLAHVDRRNSILVSASSRTASSMSSFSRQSTTPFSSLIPRTPVSIISSLPPSPNASRTNSTREYSTIIRSMSKGEKLKDRTVSFKSDYQTKRSASAIIEDYPKAKFQ